MYSIKSLSLSNEIEYHIEVWQLDLDLQAPILDADLAILSNSEYAYASSFHWHADKIRSIATRLALKKLLSSKIGIPPKDICFDKNEYGKPFVQNDVGIHFNVSHAGHHGLIAISTHKTVGVDIELCSKQIDITELAKYVFTPLERKLLINTHENFIKQWVAKEAALKALGIGISEHLQSISIIANKKSDYQIISNFPEWSDLKVSSIEAPSNYYAAIAHKN